MQYLRSQGKREGAIPFGFDLAEDEETLVTNDFEQNALDLIRKLRDRGASLRSICIELQKRKINTKTGNRRWAPQVIKELLERKDIVLSGAV